MSGKTVGNPMVEPVRLLALRVHDGRARSVQPSDAMANGRFDEKGPLIGDVARHVDGGAVSFGFQILTCLIGWLWMQPWVLRVLIE